MRARLLERGEYEYYPLIDFIADGWHAVESDTYISGWHVGAICDHLEAMTRGEIESLIINVPPGHMKSLTTSVFWLPWWWASDPTIRAIHASYSGDLSSRDSRKTSRLLGSDWYQSNFGKRFSMGKETEVRIENDKGGTRIATSTGGMGTGERAHIVVHDDLIRAQDKHSLAMRRQAVDHIKAMASRGIPGQQLRQLVVMQRLSDNDPTAYLLSEQLGYEHLCLPAEFEPARRSVTSLKTGHTWKGEDPRTAEGELLWPGGFGADKIAKAKIEQGSYDYAGQYQQRPAPAEGGIFKRSWWGEYDPAALPHFLQIIQSWDTAFKKGENNDYSACSTWGETETHWYLLEVWKGKEEFPELKRQAVALYDKWSPSAVLVEDKASGQSLIQEMQRDTRLPIVRVKVTQDKTARAYAVSPFVEAGRVKLPSRAPWLADFMDEIAQFPNGAHDDQVDTVTQALDRLIHNSTSGMLDYLREQSEDQKRAQEAA